MSVESLTVVLHHSRARGTAKLVLIGIANHDGDGGAWPSIATLARYAGGVTERNVQKALRALEALGELDTDVQSGGTVETRDALRPNRYFIRLTCPGDCDRTPQHRTSRQLRLVRDRVSVATPGVGSDTPPGVGSDTPRVSVATPEPPTNHQGEPGVARSSNPLQGTRPVDKAPEHSCADGWLADHEDKRVPCLVCKPHLARARRAASS